VRTKAAADAVMYASLQRTHGIANPVELATRSLATVNKQSAAIQQKQQQQLRRHTLKTGFVAPSLDLELIFQKCMGVARTSAVNDLVKNYRSNFALYWHDRKAFRLKQRTVAKSSFYVPAANWNCTKSNWQCFKSTAVHIRVADYMKPGELVFPATPSSAQPSGSRKRAHQGPDNTRSKRRKISAAGAVAAEQLEQTRVVHKLLPVQVQHEIRFLRTRQGRYYAVLVNAIQVATEPPAAAKGQIVAIDPGVGTAATCYCPVAGVVLKLGHGAAGKLSWMQRRLDQLRRRADPRNSEALAEFDLGTNHRQRCHLKRAADKLQERIVRLVDDAHHHLANFLCDNFEVVLIPRFATSQMVRRVGRRIGRNTARQLQTWAHYRFLQCLLYTAKRKGTTVTIVSEAYTTQCCPCCGTLHKKIGGAKVFRCPNADCRHAADRDTHGAMNIFLRFLTENLPQEVANQCNQTRPCGQRSR